MAKLMQMVIKDTINKKYSTSIELVAARKNRYYVITTTLYNGNYNRFEETYTNYETALDGYITNVKEYAEHTAYMNF